MIAWTHSFYWWLDQAFDGTDSLEFASELPLLRMGVCEDRYHSSYFVINWTENAMLFRSELCDLACKKAEDSSFNT